MQKRNENQNMKATTIMIYDDTYHMVLNHKGIGESLNNTIKRVISDYNEIKNREVE
jgi:hypothetical protein